MMLSHQDAFYKIFQKSVIFLLAGTRFTQKMQSLGFDSRLLGPVSDHFFINRVSKERALLHQVKVFP